MAAELAPVLAEKKPDLVVYEMFNAGAGIAAGLAGTPAVCHGFGRLLSGEPWSSLYDAWLALAAEHGLAQPAANQFLGNPYLDIYPPSLQSSEFSDAAERILMRPSGWQQNVELPPFVRDRTSKRPLVYVTFGTAFGTAEDLRQVIDGVSALAVDVLVSANRPEIADYLDNLPAHVAVEQWVPQWNLLPHVDLVVSHGGSGTTLDAFARGLPHLVIPQGADQFDNAQAVLDAGAGARILPGELTAEATTELAGALLEDHDVLDRAAKVAQEIAGMPSPEEALQRLAAFVH
jgi:UDP:flavonoid glycosyltransferase YjiC (YdhE family)